MLPSTLPIPSPPDGFPDSRLGLEALDRFYRFHARIYDWTRPFFLLGRRAAVRALQARPGRLVIDVGCGTGWSLPRLARTGAAVVGIEPSAPMRRRAAARLVRRGLSPAVALDPRAYGTHSDYEGRADGILFSYSLSMIPPFAEVLEGARRDLAPGGRIVVVDFLDAALPMAAGLRRSHVHLGRARLDALCGLFPSHEIQMGRAGLWRYFRFCGDSRLHLEERRGYHGLARHRHVNVAG
jgi:S-adenosylmethionine-diacylgycerolhomoserine-N-methlytransferase